MRLLLTVGIFLWGETLGVTLSTWAREGVPVEVSVGYRVRVPGGTTSVPLRGLAFRGVVPMELAGEVGGLELPILLDNSLLPLVTASLSLPTSPERDTVIAFHLTYRLRSPLAEGADEFELIVPILFVDGWPGEAREEMFQAEIRVPSGYRVTERFPSVPMFKERKEGSLVYSLSLPVVPSFFRFRMKRGGGVFTLDRIVDGVVLLLFGLLGFVGWRIFSRAS